MTATPKNKNIGRSPEKKEKGGSAFLTPIIAGLFAIIGILVGDWMGSSRAEEEWHRDRLTLLYSDCMYHSFQIESALNLREPPTWAALSEHVSECVRSGQLLFAYLEDDEWKKMNSVLSALSTYGPSYANGLTLENSRTKLQSAAREMYQLTSTSYRYDPRIFKQHDHRVFTFGHTASLIGFIALIVFLFILAAKKASTIEQQKLAEQDGESDS